jgi:hypothetical protein
MTRALVYTEDPYAGGDRWFLDRLLPQSGIPTRVTGLHWTTSYPGGDVHFSANLTAPADLNHAGLHAGRRVYIQAGGAVRWSGFLDEPGRGDPWSLTGTGLASMVNDWTASGSTATLNGFIDGAISRGLPYSRGGVSLDASITTIVNGSMTLDQALAQVGKALGKAWTLDAAGNIAMAAPPTTATYVLAARQPLNPTLVGFTQAVGYYQSSSTATAVVTAPTSVPSAAQQKWGKREGRYDMTGLGVLTSGNAQTYLNNWLSANLANWRYNNTLTVYRGDLRVPGGGIVDLATVRAGCMVLITDVDPSHETLLASGQLTMLVGATDYDVDNDVLTLTPVGMKGQDLLSIIYQSLGGAQ